MIPTPSTPSTVHETKHALRGLTKDQEELVRIIVARVLAENAQGRTNQYLFKMVGDILVDEIAKAVEEERKRVKTNVMKLGVDSLSPYNAAVKHVLDIMNRPDVYPDKE